MAPPHRPLAVPPPLPPDPALARLVAYVRRVARPRRVVLFGSRANGSARPDSDYDLLVVLDDGGPSPREVTRTLYAGKSGLYMPAADFVVTTAGALERHRDNVGLIYGEALATGRDVYVRPSADAPSGDGR